MARANDSVVRTEWVVSLVQILRVLSVGWTNFIIASLDFNTNSYCSLMLDVEKTFRVLKSTINGSETL